MKTVKFTETIKQWEGVAITRKDGQLHEMIMGVVTTDKNLKETGVKELFKEHNLIPVDTITVEVRKLQDIVTVYELELDKFKELAKISDIREENTIAQ